MPPAFSEASFGNSPGNGSRREAVFVAMPRTVDPHHFFSRAALGAALVLAIFWLWKALGIVLEHIRGDVGP